MTTSQYLHFSCDLLSGFESFNKLPKIEKRTLQFIGISEPSATCVRVEYRCPESVSRRRKRISTPRPVDDKDFIENTTIPPIIVEEGSTIAGSPSPLGTVSDGCHHLSANISSTQNIAATL
ncbi:hypothetical protein GE061_001417 [Apolygus lucorum]|uniref:Uncharacterized protein n=1 Tax=Apolygus lucorum TaxID=248454 RepID=A0A6A4IYV7_APOLU|nr:hypothetical protein GE061_001417 [Apolygus lucorum]